MKALAPDAATRVGSHEAATAALLQGRCTRSVDVGSPDPGKRDVAEGPGCHYSYGRVSVVAHGSEAVAVVELKR